MPESQQIPRKSLLDCTRQLLIDRPRKITITEIAEKIDVSASWLDALIAGRINEPSVNSIQRLYEFLKNDSLKY
jgi:transcriptional regulator with XRE-family HTH domain